ncbi:hypothetical protein EK21DRAFT_70981 [Setomelanomma holmii]|uniref:Uncharacterized protein n=1 Tax=Setomelanomma holmii TaxID=210430 RepID=A0A9P4H592_9PLEO|nr:hypothetical protein EK21DRAFT_70981 [Setomelanomma holmii]
MAPRRGGSSGSSSGGSISSCPGAFSTTIEQVYFASDVLFLAIFFGITIALCSFRKSGAGKKLIGVPYIIALVFFLLTYILSVISTVLQQCGTIGYYDYFNWAIAITVFAFLGYWLLLFVVVYTLNSMLRAQTGHRPVVFKIVTLAIVVLMGILTCTLIGMQSYNNWTQTEAGYDTNADAIIWETARFRVAYYALYMLSVLASGALALITIISQDLIGWVIALTFVMFFWSMLLLVLVAQSLQDDALEWEASAALTYLINLGQALAFIFLLCIAKHAAWSAPTVADPAYVGDAYVGAAEPKQYDHNATPGQVYYYQQAPVYNGAANPMIHPVR